MAKYGELIKEARKPENQKTVYKENQKTKKPKNQINEQEPDLVNLCVKVPRKLRQHWAAEAKRQGITMTEVIVKALMEEFGEP